MLKESWDLTPLYRSDDDPQIEKDLQMATEETDKFVAKWQSRSDYLSEPKVLLEALSDLEAFEENFGSYGKPYYYFSLRGSQDLNSSLLRAKNTQVTEVSTENANKLRFFALSLGKVSLDQQKVFLSSKELQPYYYFLETIFNESKHYLSQLEENILSLLDPSAYEKWAEMVSGLGAKEERLVLTETGKKERKNLSQLNGLIASKNKAVRDSAAQGIYDITDQYLDVAENEINALLDTRKVVDKLRSFTRPDQSRHLADHLNSSTVDILTDTVSKRFTISQRFYQLKTNLLGTKKLAYHERSAEVGELPNDYSYQKAVEIVSRSLKSLDKEFYKIFNQFTNGQIDVFPYNNKRSGAFCTYCLKTLPVYILLNHTNKLRDVTTLAHEVGHGINDRLIQKKQSALYAGTPLSTAEVASTFMEDFALNEIIAEANDEQRFAIMLMKLNDDIATICRQVAAYQFEQDLHRQYRKLGYLSKEQIGELFQKHMIDYIGPVLETDRGLANSWVFWSHFRRPFYVYSYVSGLLISKSLQASVKQDRQFITKVKEFLSAGLSDSPKNIFARLGIDIDDPAFWNKGLDEIETLLRETEQLAKKLGKI